MSTSDVGRISERWLAPVSCAAVASLAFALNAHWLPDFIALYGYHAPDWVNHLRHPEDFSADFPNGVHNYNRSLVLHLYPLLDAWLGVSPIGAVRVVLALEIAMLSTGTIMLARALPKTPTSTAIAIAVLLSLAGGLGQLDLSRTGRPNFFGLYYETADGLRLAALALMLRGKLIASAIALAAACATHPIMGGLALLAMLVFVVSTPDRHSPLRLLAAGACFVVLFGGWLATRPSAGFDAGGIPQQEWVALTRLMSAHWYTFDLGLLDRLHGRHLLPLVLFMALFAGLLSSVVADAATRRAWGMAVAMLLVLTAAGVLAGRFWPEPFVVKLNLQRASLLAVELALPVVAAGLATCCLRGSFLTSVGAAVLLLSPFVSASPVPLAAVAILLAPRIGTLRATRDGGAVMATVLLTVAVLVIAINAPEAGLGLRSGGFVFGNPLGWVAAGLLVVVSRRIARNGMPLPVASGAGAMLLVIVLAGAAAWWSWAVYVEHRVDHPRASAYTKTQLWARHETPRGTLFFVDPMFFYGWRDFSQRPSFGNLREWLHTSWLYDSNREVWLEGLRRFAEFGLRIEDYIGGDPQAQAQRLYSDFDRHHYELTDARRAEIARRYGISYFVLDARRYHGALPVWYRNEFFVVVGVPGESMPRR